MFRLLFVCLAVVVTSVKGQACEILTLPAHQDLSRERFLGSWYVLKVGTKLESEIRPISVTCHESVLSESGEENVLDFQDRFNEIENGTVIGPGIADYRIHLGEVDPNNPNPLWSIYLPGETEAAGHALIIASDESSWALEYVCFGGANPVGRLSFWSRRRYLEPLVERTLHSIARSLGFPRENFVEGEHSDC